MLVEHFKDPQIDMTRGAGFFETSIYRTNGSLVERLYQ